MKRMILGLTVGLLLSAGAGQAAAATTFGSDLSGAPKTLTSSSNFTFALTAVDPSAVAAGGAVAPSDGVVVRWRIRVTEDQGAGVTAALRIVRGNVGRGTGATEEIPMAAGTYVFPTRLPIKVGDLIGVNTSAGLHFTAVPTAADAYETWNPALPDGGSGTAPTSQSNGFARLELNADVEPDADGDGYGDETQDLCPTDASKQGDCTPPETTITVQPKAKSKAKQARLDFTSSEAGSTFECALDGSAFAGCTSPKLFKAGIGTHVFQVRAIDVAGNVDQSPASATWKVTKKHKKHHHHHHG